MDDGVPGAAQITRAMTLASPLCRGGSFAASIVGSTLREYLQSGLSFFAAGAAVEGQSKVQDDPGYKYASLRYVDNIGDNFLFRGPVPTVRPFNQPLTYDYGGLTEAMRHATPSGLSLPGNYMLIDVCLLHANETEEIAAIQSFFNDNPDLGSVTLNDTYGTPNCYFQMSEPEVQELLNTFDTWLQERLIDCAVSIRTWLDTSPFPVPVIVYVHCDGGCDRTAEIIGAYRLRYMNWSWADIATDQPCGRPLGCDNYRALQWYAFWLNATQGFSLTGIGIDDAGCSDPDIPPHRPCSPLAAGQKP